MRSFVEEYFDDKELKDLKKTITPFWTESNLKRHLNLINPVGKDVYEIGAGVGRILTSLSKDFNVSGCDASKAMVDNQISGCNIMHCTGDGEIPADNKSQDFIFSIITFQHIPSTKTIERYISESYRVLRDGGEFMFQILAVKEQDAELWTYHNPKLLVEYMEETNFTSIETQGEGRWIVIRGVK